MQTDHCGSCDAPVVWALTANGNRMPVDADPDSLGNVELIDDGAVRVQIVDPAQPALDGPDRHMSHFVTCPQASAWRRR